MVHELGNFVPFRRDIMKAMCAEMYSNTPLTYDAIVAFPNHYLNLPIYIVQRDYLWRRSDSNRPQSVVHVFLHDWMDVNNAQLFWACLSDVDEGCGVPVNVRDLPLARRLSLGHCAGFGCNCFIHNFVVIIKPCKNKQLFEMATCAQNSRVHLYHFFNICVLMDLKMRRQDSGLLYILKAIKNAIDTNIIFS